MKIVNSVSFFVHKCFESFSILLRVFVIVLWVFLVNTTSIGQTIDPFEQAQNILPPAPTAGELGKYGLVPIGMSTGTANVEIPLYQFKTKFLAVPIALNYSSAGVKVDQLATWVGLGWSIQSGGVITRVVRDMPDDENSVFPYPDNFDSDNILALEYLKSAAEDPFFDSEPDMFMYNFPGYTGKFVFDRSGTAIVMPHINILIEREIDKETNRDIFRITTPDGVLYTFAYSEFTRTENVGGGCGRSYELEVQSSWFLTEIRHPAGEKITLEYDGRHVYRYATGVTQSVMKRIGPIGTPQENACPEFDFPTTCKNIQVITGGHLKRISSPEFGMIEFYASLSRPDVADYRLDSIMITNRNGTACRSFAFEYEFSTSSGYDNTLTTNDLKHRMFLSSVHERDQVRKKIKTHTFIYEDINGLPPRLAFAQDHWGYFNGANNQYFVPFDDQARVDDLGRELFANIGGNREVNHNFSRKGLLKEIIYPTGGRTKLFFEPNQYSGTKKVFPPTESLELNVQGEDFKTRITTVSTFENVVTQYVQIGLSTSENPDASSQEVDPLHHIGDFSLFDETTSSVVVSGNVDLNSHQVFNAKLEEDHRYRITLGASGELVRSYLSLAYAPYGPTVTSGNFETGGLRVAKIENTDPSTGKVETVQYQYHSLDLPLKSTGILGATPRYSVGSITVKAMQNSSGFPGSGGIQECRYGTLYSSSQVNLYPMNGNNVYYSTVVVSRGTGYEFGAEEHVFEINPDQPAQPVWGTSDILNATYSNEGWNNGLEKIVRTYKRSGGSLVLIKQVENNYESDPRNRKEVKGLVARKKFDLILTGELQVLCTSANVNSVTRNYTCVANHSHIWILGKITICIQAGAHHDWRIERHHPCYDHEPGETITQPQLLANVDAVEYRNIGFWHYLKSSTETVYDENGLNPVVSTTTYNYDNPGHALVTRIARSRSDGKTAVTYQYYPQDYAASVGNLSALIDKNIVNVPCKTLETVNGEIISGRILSYNLNGQPFEVFELKGKAPLTAHDPTVLVTSEFEKAGQLDYDDVGNIKHVTSRKAPRISYKWGYNGSRIVAKAVNATEDQIYYNGFEEAGTLAEGSMTARTGERYLNSSTYVISVAEFAPVQSADLVMSYWYYQNDKWYYSGEFPFSRTIVAGQSLDEIRVYPRGAQITTVTYDSLTDEVMSMTDANNITTNYTYDAFGRLLKIRDNDLNTIQEYKYLYFLNP